MNIKEYLDSLAKSYYAGNPLVSDEEFDALTEQYAYVQIGAKPSTGIPHLYPLYSLQKVYAGDKLPFTDGIKTVKLDGAAVSLTYIKGHLTLGLTRGDGVRGQPCTQHLRNIGIPIFINTVLDCIQITGEVVAPATIKNARNYAAGALNLKDPEEIKERHLQFFAYGVTPYVNVNYSTDMHQLSEIGFNTVLEIMPGVFPSDGFVYRIDNNKKFEEEGYTSHHPRGAYALKEQKEGVVTKLQHVIWNVGRSGAVSPVAVLAPVEIDGAIISKATLHNMKYIKALGLEEGCMVKVIRSGDIIPRVVSRVN